MNQYFNSKYPIVEAAMNGGSDLPLALACWDAGIFPSLLLQELSDDDYQDKVNEILKEFVKVTGSANVVFAITFQDLLRMPLLKLLKSFNVSHIEVLPVVPNLNGAASPESDWLEKNYGMNHQKLIQSIVTFIHPMKIMRRRTRLVVNDMYASHGFSYCLKGSDSAGINARTISTEEMFNQQQQLTPGASLIPYGGIGTPEQVADYMRRGAVAVGVGTLLAASKESSLSTETKLAMISHNKDKIIKLDDTGQNTLILGNQADVLQDDSDWNRAKSLELGLRGDGKSGHIYVGSAVDHITEIKSVKQIVEYLVSELP